MNHQKINFSSFFSSACPERPTDRQVPGPADLPDDSVPRRKLRKGSQEPAHHQDAGTFDRIYCFVVIFELISFHWRPYH